jgi:diguanylate cyclase (GGDEF)-like protein
VPLKRHDLIVGVIAIANPLRAPAFDPRDSILLEQLAPTLYGIVGANYDEDTGLLTRQAFEEEVADRLAEDSLQPRCIVYGDVDCLHAINDMGGLSRGDDAVRAAAQVWHHALLPGGLLISRLSGDRFAALLENCTLNQARVWAEGVRVAIAEIRLASGGAALSMTASFGISRLTADQTLNCALTAAGIACKAAKDRGRNRVELFDDIDATVKQRRNDMRVFRDLVDALDVGRFRLFAQPLVPFADSAQPTHYEILVGMNDDRGSIVASNKFMPIAIRHHLRTRLDKWVLTQAVAQLNRNRAALQNHQTVFWINLSSQSLVHAEFAHFAYDAVRDSELASGSIAFEITENAAIDNLHAAQRFVSRLMGLECRLALDEFGTGLSSLKLLNDLQVSMLKIDGRFIRDVSHDPRLDSVVRAVLQVAAELGLDTAAECIESRAAANHVAALGVSFGQGCELGRPEPLNEVLEALPCRPRRFATSVCERTELR